MSKSLRLVGFQLLVYEKINLDKYDGSSLRGCVLEVKFEYRKKLHEWHNQYPLAPDKLEVKREIFSDYQLKIRDDYNIPIGSIKKLTKTCNFTQSYNYK